MLLGVNIFDVGFNISQQLLFNICSFSRCLAQWTKCYGNLSVLCREVLPVWMMVGLASTVCHVHLEPNSLARPGQWSCWPLSQYFLSRADLNTTKVCVARDWGVREGARVTVAEQESKVSIRC